MRKIVERSTNYYWFNPSKGGLFPKSYNEYLFNHITFVQANEDLFDLPVGTVKETFEKYNEPIGSEGKARQEIIDLVIAKGWLRARYWIKGILATWYIEVGDKSYQKKLINDFFSSVMEKMRKDDKIVLIDSQGENYYSLPEFIRLFEIKRSLR